MNIRVDSKDGGRTKVEIGLELHNFNSFEKLIPLYEEIKRIERESLLKEKQFGKLFNGYR